MSPTQTPTPAHYAVSLSVAGQPCLVVGGGPIAARKIEGLVACGAEVTVVAPTIVPHIADLTEKPPAGGGAVALRRRPYRAGEATSYRLVIAATGVRAVDQLVARDADQAGVWVNVADDPARCTFFLPSVHRQGPVTLAVSTGGESPALAAWLRRRLGAVVGPEMSAMAVMMGEARRALLDDGRSTEAADWGAILAGPFPDLVAAGELDAAKDLLRAQLNLPSDSGTTGEQT